MAEFVAESKDVAPSAATHVGLPKGAHKLGKSKSSHDHEVSVEELLQSEQGSTPESRAEELAKCSELKKNCPAARPDQLVRFLRARKGNVEKATEMLSQHIDWREKTFPVQLSDTVKEELAKDKYCAHGRDKDGRMVVIVRTKLMGKHTYDTIETVEASLVYVAEYIESQLGGLEKMTVIFSRLDSSRENADLNWIKSAAKIFQNHYPERLHVALVAPVGIFFRGLWAVASKFFDPDTRAKIEFAGDTEVFKSRLDKIPADIGGDCEHPISAESILKYAKDLSLLWNEE